MAKHYVFSTLTNHQNYANWGKPVSGNLPVLVEQVRIEGGANRATKQLVTPLGVSTEVSDEQLAILERNFLFQQHKKDGYIVVRSKNVDPEVAVAADMKQKDDSAPTTPESLEALGHKPADKGKRKAA